MKRPPRELVLASNEATGNRDRRVLGYLLAQYRKQHRLTQSEVASAAGLSRQMLCGVEKGREAPSVLSLSHLLTAIGEEHQVTDNNTVIWGSYIIVCPRFSHYRLIGPPDRQVVPADVRVEGGFIQILDWR